MVDVTIRRFVPGDSQWLVARHQDLWAREQGVDDTYGAAIADVVQGYCETHDPNREQGWVAAKGARRLGSIFCLRHGADTARVRLFLLLPEVRRQGLGKRLLRDCMGFARQCGYRDMVLSTRENHRNSGALYRAFGWKLTDSRPIHSYGVDLIEQTWRVML